MCIILALFSFEGIYRFDTPDLPNLFQSKCEKLPHLQTIVEQNDPRTNLHWYMACKEGAICKNVIAAHFTIMSYMTRSHDKIVITDNLNFTILQFQSKN